MDDDDGDIGIGEGSLQEAQPRRPLLLRPPPMTHKGRLFIFMQWAKVELLGFLVLFAAGTALGLIMPVNHHLTEPYGRISNVVGYIYFLAWTVSFYPQIIENYHRGTTIGLSLDFEIFNLIGFCCYSAFSLSFKFSAAIQDEYMARHNGNTNKVETQDVLFAVHAVAITLVTITQMFYYDGIKQHVSVPSGILMAAMLVSIAIYAVVVWASSEGGKWRTWYDWLYFVSYIKLLISTVKGIPQFIINWRRQSTEGWNIHNVLLDATGGSLSLLQLLLDCYNTDDWSGIQAYPLKFGLSIVSLLFDVIFSLQHFIWYPNPKKQLNAAHVYGLLDVGDEEAVDMKDGSRGGEKAR